MNKLSVGGRYVSPVSEANGEFDENCGITYRHWLIGMALQKLCELEADKHGVKLIAESAVMHADAVISHLDREEYV